MRGELAICAGGATSPAGTEGCAASPAIYKPAQKWQWVYRIDFLLSKIYYLILRKNFLKSRVWEITEPVIS
jgi:hypothetical protein